MKLKKIIFTAYLIIGVCLTNCNWNDCNCPEVKHKYFDILGIGRIMHYASYENGGSGHLAEGDTINFQEYNGFQLEFMIDYISENIPHASAGGSELMACSCIGEGEYGSKEEMFKSIYVTTLNPFNSEFGSNDTINQIIEMENLPLEDYLNTHSAEFINYPFISFKLMEAPVTEKQLSLKIYMELNTGEKYEKELPVVVME